MKKVFAIFLYFLISHNSFASEGVKKQLNYAISVCQKDMQQLTASGLTIPKYLKFCECYMTQLIYAADEKEMNYQKKYGKPSGKFIKIAKKTKKKCEKKVK